MRIKSITLPSLAVLLGACQAKPPEPTTAVETEGAAPAAPKPIPSAPADRGTAGTPGGLPDDRIPLDEGSIDPKSAEGAGQVLQRYGALLEQRKFAEARALWGNGGDASGLTEARFAAAYAKYAQIHAEVGKPGLTEGAAGSIYIEVPVQLYGTLTSGGTFNLVGPVTLKRVNDVDGATAAQLRWHIVESGLKPRR